MNREDLKDYKYNQEWIKGRLEYLEEYRATITKITSTLSDMPHASSSVPDKMAEKISIMIDNVGEMLDKVNEYNKKQEEILKQLDQVEQPYRLILEKAYIQGKKLVTVASEMNYNYEYMKKMNGVALNKFDELENRERKVTESYH